MNWKDKAIELAQEGYSWRKVAYTLGVPRTTVSDFLRKEFKQKQVTASPHPPKEEGLKIAVVAIKHG